MDDSNKILIRLHVGFVNSIIFILNNRYHILSVELSLDIDFTYENVILTLFLGVNQADARDYLLLLF